MNRTLRVILWTLVGASVGLFMGSMFVALVGIQPGDRTDLLVIAAIAALFAAMGFWWGRRNRPVIDPE